MDGQPNMYASDAKIFGDFIANSMELTEAIQVKEWLEETAPEFQAVEVRKGYYPHTFKALKDRQRLNLTDARVVRELDPDAQLRTKGVLEIGDQVGELESFPSGLSILTSLFFRITRTSYVKPFTPIFVVAGQRTPFTCVSRATNHGVLRVSWVALFTLTRSWVRIADRSLKPQK